MFQLPEEVKEDMKNYKHSLETLLKGEVSPSRFKGVRVPWGLYSHRGGKVYMSRIRIPAGLVTPQQLKALAEASLDYGDGVLHITTRQDIQIHNVKLEDTVKAIEYLKDYHLSPRGGGGNTVRNVIACPRSGICSDEAFDVKRYAIALTEYLLRQDTSFTLPRKFKISFSACTKDCAGCLVNDLGFLARYNGGKEGFTVYVGGGMGVDSRVGGLLEEFIPHTELGYCVAAVKNIFYRMGDRRNKHHNRLRFLIEDIGFDDFEKVYREELQRIKKDEHIVLRKIDFPAQEEAEEEIARREDEDYQEFLRYNVHVQKQKGFHSVTLRIPRGDITAKQLIALADLEQEFPGIEFRTTQEQNLLIAWIRNQTLDTLFLKLKKILNDFLYPTTLLDVVACKGAITCNIGLCNSPGLAREIEDLVHQEFIGTNVFRKLEIKLNGCPNACGQQPIGKLSLSGLVRRVDIHPAPFYKFFLGGRKEAESTRLATEAGIVPAKNIPAFLRSFLKRTETEIDEHTDIHDFLASKARGIAEEILEKYSYIPPYQTDRDFYVDWGKTEEFSLTGLGPGECSAGVIDIIEADLADAKVALETAKKTDYAAAALKKALTCSARALLVVKGKDPTTEAEILSGFNEVFIDQGIASDVYADIKKVFETIDAKSHHEERKNTFSYAKNFYEHISELYKNMDSSFNFLKLGKEVSSQKEDVQTPVLDLKGTPCPMNYVKTKLALENLTAGELLTVLLDEGEPIKNVPGSLKDDGHDVISIEKQDGFYRVTVKKMR